MSTHRQAGSAPQARDPWRDSLRRSHERRDRAFRRRRRRLRGRGAVAVAVALFSLTGLAGGALAATGGGSTATAPSAAAASATTLRTGATGGGVAALQQALGIPADGIYGPQTRAAVRRFQRAHGLRADGVAGPATLSALGVSARTASAGRSSSSSSSAPSSTLERIAQCESGGDPTVVSANGLYRGKYQFSRETWQAMGGSGDPAAASEAEQDRRAARLLAVQGASAWPVCAGG